MTGRIIVVGGAIAGSTAAGLVVAGLATGTPPSLDLGPYDPARFAAA